METGLWGPQSRGDLEIAAPAMEESWGLGLAPTLLASAPHMKITGLG